MTVWGQIYEYFYAFQFTASIFSSKVGVQIEVKEKEEVR